VCVLFSRDFPVIYHLWRLSHHTGFLICVGNFRKWFLWHPSFLNVAHGFLPNSRERCSGPVSVHLVESYLIKGDQPFSDHTTLPIITTTSSFILANYTKRRIWSELTPARCCIAGAMCIHVGNTLHLRRHVLFINASGDAQPPDPAGSGPTAASSQSRLLNQWCVLKFFEWIGDLLTFYLVNLLDISMHDWFVI
jgi:hypothetical protein